MTNTQTKTKSTIQNTHMLASMSRDSSFETCEYFDEVGENWEAVLDKSTMDPIIDGHSVITESNSPSIQAVRNVQQHKAFPAIEVQNERKINQMKCMKSIQEPQAPPFLEKMHSMQTDRSALIHGPKSHRLENMRQEIE